MRSIGVVFLALLLCGCGFAQADAVVKEIPADAIQEKLAPLPAAHKLLREGEYKAAADAFRALVALGSNPQATAGLVRSLLRMDDPGGAKDLIAKALKDFPADPAIHEANGEVLYRSGMPWDAEIEFAKTINTWGANAQAYLWLSRIYTAEAYHKKSRTMIERAFKIDPDDPEVRSAYYRQMSGAQPIAIQLSDEGDAAAALQQIASVVSARHRGCKSVTASGEVQANLMPLHTDAQHIHGFGLELNFNGQRGKLLLDTGAGSILINRRLAERAGVTRVASSTVYGIGDKGGQASYLGHIDVIKLGNLEMRDCIVEVSDTRNVLNDDGLIGTDLFEDFMVHLDFPHMKFKLSALPPRPEQSKVAEAKGSAEADGRKSEPELFDPYKGAELQDFTRMYRVGHYLLIPTRINDLPPRLFLLDTGAFSNLISPDAAREVTKVRGDAWMTVKGLNGKVNNVFTADQATLQFSRYRQMNQEITSFDMSNISRSAGMELSGALGFTTVRLLEITIDYRDGVIDFKYDPKAFPWLR